MTLRRELLQNRRLYLIVNITPGHQPSFAKLEAILRGGADMVQLRCKEVADSVFLEYAFKLHKLCRDNNLLYIVNDRADMVLLSDADGLHIGQDDIPPHLARRIIGDNKILGLSTHNLTQVEKARTYKELDYIGVGPVFKTETKLKRKPTGLDLIKNISKYEDMLPFFAIGGITAANLRPLIKAGAEKIAVSGAVFSSKDPVQAAGKLKEILQTTPCQRKGVRLRGKFSPYRI